LAKSYSQVAIDLARGRSIDGNLNTAANEVISRAILLRVDALFDRFDLLRSRDFELHSLVVTSLEHHEASLDRSAGLYDAQRKPIGLDLPAHGLHTGTAGTKYQHQNRKTERHHGFLRKWFQDAKTSTRRSISTVVLSDLSQMNAFWGFGCDSKELGYPPERTIATACPKSPPIRPLPAIACQRP
jgi:hypothetical protein